MLHVVLFEGERKRRKKVTQCMSCDRMICRNEYYYAKVVLTDRDGCRQVEFKHLCKGCK